MLANRAGIPYPQPLEQQVTGPLGMQNTAIALSSAMRARLVAGHTGDHRPAHNRDLDAPAGAGGIRSTATDMLTYLKAQLHPDLLPEPSSNTTTNPATFTDKLSQHIAQRLAGVPPVSLQP